MKDLYQLSKEYEFLLELDEYSDEDMKRLEEINLSIQDQIIEKCKVIKLLDMKSQNIHQLITEYQNKLDLLNKKIDKLNELVKYSMEVSSLLTVNSTYFDVKLRRNSPSVDDYNTKLIPEEYWRKKEVVTLDKRMIQEHIANGKNIPGARLVKKLRLEIK